MNTLDVRSLLQDDAIEHVEMGEADNDTVSEASTANTKDSKDEDEEVRYSHSKTVLFTRRSYINNNNNNHADVDKCMKYKYCN